jgi:PIN domain nuclease of toxin-antitoxin system
LTEAADSTPRQVERELEQLTALVEPIAYSLEQANLASWWFARKHPYNRSLGDCARLGAAESTDSEVLTAEQRWPKLPNPRVRVSLIR